MANIVMEVLLCFEGCWWWSKDASILKESKEAWDYVGGDVSFGLLSPGRIPPVDVCIVPVFVVATKDASQRMCC